MYKNKSSSFNDDQKWMHLALLLAQKGRFTTDPNPNVGCVIVKNDRLLGEGFHCKTGKAHAEVVALENAQHEAKNATVYVTLEPCAHHGKTPPCALALIKAKVSRVVIGMIDPNPNVSGNGIKLLEEAGIKVDFCFDFKSELEELNKGFLKRMRTGFPFVQLKLAASLDGKIALENGESKWITNSQSRQDVQTYRAQASLILSTSQTVIIDDASLTVRKMDWNEQLKHDYPIDLIRQPIRCILDKHERLTGNETLFKTDGIIWLVRINSEFFPENVFFIDPELVYIDDKINFEKLYHYFGQQGINTVWIEAGSKFAGALIDAQAIDELIIYYAPKLLGDKSRSMFQFSLTQLDKAPIFKIQQVDNINGDLKVIMRY